MSDVYFDVLNCTFTTAPSKDPHEKLKTAVRRTAHELREETVQFIEEQAIMAEHRSLSESEEQPAPRLPVFYIKGYNLLKRLLRTAVGADYKCPILELLPAAVEMSWLSEFGSRHKVPSLVLMDNGCLRYEHQDAPEEVQVLLEELANDMEEYFFNYISIHGECPKFPRFFELMRTYMKKRFPMYSFAEFGQNMNQYLTTILGEEHIAANYFEKNGSP